MVLTTNNFLKYKRYWKRLRKSVLNENKNKLNWVKPYFTFKPFRFSPIKKRTNEFNENYMIYENYNYQKYGNLGWNYIFGQDKLYEGLIKTMDINDFIEHFPNIVKVTMDIGYDYLDEQCRTPFVLIAILEKDYNNYHKDIKKYALACGYYIVDDYESKSDDNSLDIHIFKLEPKFIVECADLIYKNKENMILYHITLNKRYDKIKNNGLIPKSHNKKSEHPERVYLFLPGNYSKTDFRNQANRLYKQDNMPYYRKEISKYMLNDMGKLDINVLKIDLSKSQLTYMFFYDPNHPNGIFTYEMINPKCVDILYSFSI